MVSDARVDLAQILLLISLLTYSGSAQSDRREEINGLSPEALNQFRNNVQRIQDSGEWVNLAADHGIPNQYCPHGNLRFVIWHRRQIARLEEMLGQKLPYWDWAKNNGVPGPCKDQTYTSASGEQLPNPLYAGPKFGGDSTIRNALDDFNTESLRNQEQMAIAATKFEDFSQYVEGAHNDIHGDIGGDMNTLDYSAFDPIFWMHHNNVDRIWYRWQRRNRFAMYPDESRGEMQDSIGIFMGEDVIQDLSGWIPGGHQPNVSESQTPTMSSSGSVRGTGRDWPGFAENIRKKFQPLAADDQPSDLHQDHPLNRTSNSTTSSKAPAFLSSLKSVRHQVHDLQAPLEIVTSIDDDPALRTFAEQPGYRSQNRTVMMLKGIEAASDPYRIDIYLSGQLISWIHTFGMGKSNMKYKLNRLLDITKQSQHCAKEDIKSKLHFRVTNQKTGQVDTGKAYDLELVNMVF